MCVWEGGGRGVGLREDGGLAAVSLHLYGSCTVNEPSMLSLADKRHGRAAESPLKDPPLMSARREGDRERERWTV